ncbi:MAG: hypothetical protein OXL68_11570, partial [Paracoccaceae bacterium]|nr:hypothetical protein [Paracoccaceae bacterium]
ANSSNSFPTTSVSSTATVRRRWIEDHFPNHPAPTYPFVHFSTPCYCCLMRFGQFHTLISIENLHAVREADK